MKKILLLLLFTVASYGQAVFDEGIQITGNANSVTATKVNVQETDGKVNTKTINTAFNKNFGLNTGDVVGATTLLNQYSTTPIDWTSTSFSSGQVVFYGGKQWIAKIATVAGDVPSVSSKWDDITFEALSNKTVTVDQTIIDGSTNAVSGNAVFDGLVLKAPLASPSLTGTPTAPTATAGTANTQVANTAFVINSKNFRNVKDFGAKGDGATDDTSAISAALSSLPITGGILFFPNGVYHSLTGFNFIKDNLTIIGESMPRCSDDKNSLTGGVILRGQVLIDGNNIDVKNIGVDYGINYSNTYRSGVGGNALVIHKNGLGSIIKNVNVENVIGLIRIGGFNDAQAAYHAILLEGIQYGNASNVTGIGGWFGVVVKATDFKMNNILGRENDAVSIYLKSNTYAPSNRITATNLIVENYTSRGYVGVLVQSSDAEMENISVSNVTVTGGDTAFRVESETTQPLVSFSLSGLTARNTKAGFSVRGAVYSPVVSNISIYKPLGSGFTATQNSVASNPIDIIATNIRIVPSLTTTDALKIDNANFFGIFNNVNVCNSDGNSIIAGSVINVMDNTIVNNFKGILKRDNIISERYKFTGGETVTGLTDISSKTQTRKDFANPVISLAEGYLSSDRPFIQSYNNFNNVANSLSINPFGGDVVLGGNLSATNYTGGANLTGTPTAPTAPAGTNTSQIATTAFVQANASSGSYTPTASVITGATGVIVGSHTYTKIGNIVTVYGESKPSSVVAAVGVVYEIGLPIARANTVTKAIGFGGINVPGASINQHVRLESSSTTTARIAFNVNAAGTPTLSYSFQYDVTQ